MSDETQVLSDQPSGQGDGDGNAPGQQAVTPATFTQADVDRIVKERLAKAQSKAEEATRKAAADAEAKTLAEQGEFKRLYEKLQADFQAQAERVAAMERQRTQGEIASKLGLPASLASRLQGATPEEMEADAKALLDALPKPTAPNINPTPGGVNSTQLGAADAAELAAIYGVNPKYLKG
jgi:hypothetical protein